MLTRVLSRRVRSRAEPLLTVLGTIIDDSRFDLLVVNIAVTSFYPTKPLYLPMLCRASMGSLPLALRVTAINPFIGYPSQRERGLSRDPTSLFTRSVSVHILANNALRAHHASAHGGLSSGGSWGLGDLGPAILWGPLQRFSSGGAGSPPAGSGPRRQSINFWQQ